MGKKVITLEEKISNFVNELATIRKSKGVSTYTLETMTGIRQANITRMETGKATPNLETILKYTTALDIELKLVY